MSDVVIDIIHDLGNDQKVSAARKLHQLLYPPNIITLELQGNFNRYVKDDIRLDFHCSGHPQLVSYTLKNIAQVVQYAPTSEFYTSIDELLEVMSSINLDDPWFNRLYQFIESFNQEIIKTSYDKVLQFLNKTFNYELRQLPNLKLHLQDLDIYLLEEQIQAIGTMIDVPITNDETHDTFEGFQSKLSFESNDTDFTSLFYLFLQISSFSLSSSPIDQDFSSYSALMLSIYSQKVNSDWISLSNMDETVRKLTHELFQDNYAAIDLIFLQTRSNETDNSRNSFVISAQDEHELIRNVQTLISQFNEFNFNFDPLFPKTLKRFIQYVNADDEIVTTDDIRFLDDVIKLVNMIVDYSNNEESNPAMLYEVSVKFYKLQFYLSTEFEATEKPIGMSLLMKLVTSETKKNKEKLKKHLKSWNLRILQLSQLKYNLEVEWVGHQSTIAIRSSFNLWLRKFNKVLKLNYGSGNFYDENLLMKHLLLKWIPKYQNIKFLNQKDKNFRTRKIIERWKEKKKNKEQQQEKADTFYHSNLLRRHFSLLAYKYNDTNIFKAQSDEFHNRYEVKTNELLLKHCFAAWNQKFITSLGSEEDVEYLTKKIRTLNITESRVVLSSHLNKWKRAYKLRTVENESKDRRNYLLIHHFFTKWSSSYKLRFVASRFEFDREKAIQQNLFAHWYKSSLQMSKSSEYHNQRLIAKMWKSWRLKTRSYETSTATIFKRWILKYQCQQLAKKKNLQLTESFFNKWIEAGGQNKELFNVSVELHETFLASKSLHKWVRKALYDTTLEQKADQFYLKKFWMIFRTKMDTYNELDALSDNMGYSLYHKILVEAALHAWQGKYENAFEQRSIPKITYLQQEVVYPNLRRSQLAKWVQKFNHQQIRNQELDVAYEKFVLNSKLFDTLMRKWIGKTSHLVDLEERAEDFRRNVLYKKHLVIWFDQYNSKIMHLNNLAQEFRDHKDLNFQRDIISKWSMKYIKFITRNQQSCELFIKRWEASRMKSIFDLWIYKLNSHQSGENNNIFLSDSPLAMKSKSIFESPEKEESYLNSPVKATMTPYTPSTNISPSRLQASLKMRNEKLKALSERYRKGSPGPPTRPLFSRTPKKVEPIPKLEYFQVTKEDIADAKRKGKITPIKVPESDDESPTRTIRRIRS